MPTYDYACQECGHTFEVFQSMRDEPLKKCPKCGKPRLKRLLGTGAGLIFKGSGFYITDYKNKQPDGGKKEGGEAKSGESKSSDAKGGDKKTSSDSKPSSDSKSSKGPSSPKD